MTILESMKNISELENALAELAGQTEVSDFSESFLAELCLSRDLSTDLRVASILRVISIDSRLVYNSSHRRVAINIVLNRLEKSAPSVLEDYKISKKDMADVLSHKLANIEPDAVASLKQSIAKYNGIDKLVDFRQRFLQGIKHNIVKVSLHPFLNLGPNPAETLNRCLQAAVNYSQSNLAQARIAFDTSQMELDKIIARLDKLPTKPGTLISEQLQILQDDIKDHFEASPFSKQANLEINPSLRKHPLHIKDIELSIPIEIRNIGKGIAFDVEIGLTKSIGLLPIGSISRISDIAPGSMIVEIPAQTDPAIIARSVNATCKFYLSWINADGTNGDREIIVDLEPQNDNIAWEDVRSDNPYSLEAVTKEDDLIGRSEILNRIVGILTTPSVGSLYIFGQKRVGKTSLTKVAQNQLKKNPNTCFVYIDIETIATANPDPVSAINKLTERLAQSLQKEIPATRHLEIKLDGSLSPLVDILEMSTQLGMNTIIALDEFDTLPFQLFRRTREQKVLFAGLRALSTIEGVGIILIGGECMNFIINGPPGVRLNKFESVPIGILDRETQWHDFELLIKTPAEKYLDFSGKAISLIYDYTAGHPYYTKLLCAKILKGATERRDSYIGVREVNSALGHLFREIDSTSFSHYWDDYILEEEADQEEIISFNRRQCLVAFGKICDVNLQASLESIYAETSSAGLNIMDSEHIVKEYDRRGILKIYDQTVEPCIRLFGHWITNEGQSITMNRTEIAFVKSIEFEREKLRIASEEVEQLIKNWDSYKGKFITEDKIFSFLQQFNTPLDRRIIFKILKNLYFIRGIEEEKYWKNAFQNLQYSLKERDGTWQQKQIRISHFGDIGKSSLAMARSFAWANKFPRDNRMILEPSQISKALNDGVSDIVICDDFVGTGQTLLNDLYDFKEFVTAEQQVHVFILSGMADGIDKITSKAYEIYGTDRISIRCLHELSSKLEIFDIKSKVFDSAEEAERALRLLRDFGSRLVPNAPLGYGDCCSLITFQRTIPNNAPPILWKESTGDFQFQPLFPRL